MNPVAHNIGTFHLVFPPKIVAAQLKTLIPVGTAIVIVAAEKYARVSMSSPTVNMWCAHTMNPNVVIASIAHTIL